MKRISKKLAIFMMSMLAALTMAVSAFAESTGGSANQAVVSAMSSVANDMTATATSLIPIALGVVGIAMVVIFGIKIFKRIANRG